MKILLLTPFIPYPLSEGGKIAQYAVIDSLRKFCKLVLIVNVYSKYDEDHVNILKQHWPEVEFREIQFFQQAQKVSFKEKIKNSLRRNTQKINDAFISPFKEKADRIIYDTDISYFINIFEIKQRKLVNEITAIINDVKPDIIQTDMLDYIDLVFAIPPSIRKVFVHHELRFVRLQSFFNRNKFKPAPYDDYIIEKIRNEEIALLKQYDGIFVFSEEDKKKLLKEGLDKNIYTTPFSVLDKYFIPVTKENAVIKKLVFVGAENHSPNADAVEWYINEIAAEINKVKKIVLHVIGKWSKRTVNKYKHNTDIQFAGYVEDLIGYCKQSIMLVPVRIGSGIRTKILYAMAQGVPVISTTIGCEGICVENNKSIFIADTPAEFGIAYKTILNNKDTTLNMIQSAQAAVRTYYSQENTSALRMKYFEELLLN